MTAPAPPPNPATHSSSGGHSPESHQPLPTPHSSTLCRDLHLESSPPATSGFAGAEQASSVMPMKHPTQPIHLIAPGDCQPGGVLITLTLAAAVAGLAAARSTARDGQQQCQQHRTASSHAEVEGLSMFPTLTGEPYSGAVGVTAAGQQDPWRDKVCAMSRAVAAAFRTAAVGAAASAASTRPAAATVVPACTTADLIINSPASYPAVPAELSPDSLSSTFSDSPAAATHVKGPKAEPAVAPYPPACGEDDHGGDGAVDSVAALGHLKRESWGSDDSDAGCASPDDAGGTSQPASDGGNQQVQHSGSDCTAGVLIQGGKACDTVEGTGHLADDHEGGRHRPCRTVHIDQEALSRLSRVSRPATAPGQLPDYLAGQPDQQLTGQLVRPSRSQHSSPQFGTSDQLKCLFHFDSPTNGSSGSSSNGSGWRDSSLSSSIWAAPASAVLRVGHRRAASASWQSPRADSYSSPTSRSSTSAMAAGTAAGSMAGGTEDGESEEPDTPRSGSRNTSPFATPLFLSPPIERSRPSVQSGSAGGTREIDPAGRTPSPIRMRSATALFPELAGTSVPLSVPLSVPPGEPCRSCAVPHSMPLEQAATADRCSAPESSIALPTRGSSAPQLHLSSHLSACAASQPLCVAPRLPCAESPSSSAGSSECPSTPRSTTPDTSPFSTPDASPFRTTPDTSPFATSHRAPAPADHLFWSPQQPSRRRAPPTHCLSSQLLLSRTLLQRQQRQQGDAVSGQRAGSGGRRLQQLSRFASCGSSCEALDRALALVERRCPLAGIAAAASNPPAPVVTATLPGSAAPLMPDSPRRCSAAAALNPFAASHGGDRTGLNSPFSAPVGPTGSLATPRSSVSLPPPPQCSSPSVDDISYVSIVASRGDEGTLSPSTAVHGSSCVDGDGRCDSPRRAVALAAAAANPFAGSFATDGRPGCGASRSDDAPPHAANHLAAMNAGLSSSSSTGAGAGEPSASPRAECLHASAGGMGQSSTWLRAAVSHQHCLK